MARHLATNNYLNQFKREVSRHMGSLIVPNISVVYQWYKMYPQNARTQTIYLFQHFPPLGISNTILYGKLKLF